jgi:hypothetical protein
MGTANAIVFPEPVWADPMQSRPVRMGGIQAVCTDVGARIDMLANERFKKASTPKLVKLAMAQVG